MKGLKGKLKRVLLIALAVAMMIPVQNVYAATTRQLAISSYKRLLSRKSVKIFEDNTKSSEVKFAITYIDNDNVPELILYGEHKLAVLTYKNGTAVRVYAGAYYTPSYYPKRGVFVAKGLDDFVYYCSINRKFVEKFYSCPSENYRCERYINPNRAPKELTAAQLRERLKVYTKNTKQTKPVFYKNTKVNRDRLIK